MDNLSLRGYTPDDLGAMAALDAVCFAEAFRFSRSVLRRFAEARRALVQLAVAPAEAATDEVLAGFCIVHVERSGHGDLFGYVVTLDIAENFRGRGLGSFLLQSMQLAAHRAGAQAMELHVSVENYAAVRLYERLGYQVTGRVAGFYGKGGDALVYRRELLLAEVASPPPI